MPLAQLNVARMQTPLDSPQMASFVARLDEVNAAAESSDGFVWRLTDEGGSDATGYRLLNDELMLVNLSVWRDLASLRAFVIGHDGHRSALQSRRDWFEPAREPMTVCWPIPEGHVPTVQEAEERLLRLRADGPSDDLFAFSYRD